MKRAAHFLLTCGLLIPLIACAEGNGTGPGGAGGGSSGSSSGGAGGQGGSEIPIEPSGPPKLTLVNGINDYEAIRACFVPYPDGGDPDPIPAEATGLAFAAPLVIPDGNPAIAKDKDLLLHVIAGDLAKTAQKGCAELVNSPPAGVLVAPIAVIPASAFTAERSLLVVPNGCLGGDGHTDPLEQQACGQGYSIDTPTTNLVAAGMSRLLTQHTLSLQAAHASPAMPMVDIRILSGIMGTMPYLVAPSLTPGQVGPFPPFQKLSRVSLGPIMSAQIGTFSPNQTTASSALSLSDALARGGIDPADFADGKGFTLVAVGAAPGVAKGAFWHPLTWVVVRADP